MVNFLKNYFSTLFFILIIFSFYYFSDFNNSFFLKIFSLKFIDFKLYSLNIYLGILITYIILLIPFYYFHNKESKALIIINYLINKIKNNNTKFKKKVKISILAWIVKGFFAPLMILWFSDHIFTVINNSYLSYNDIHLFKDNFVLFFNKHFFWFFFTIILSIDVFFFTLGYLIESPKLKNTIKSVEPTIFGWIIVLICYPPFNTYTVELIGWYSENFPQFNNNYLHITLNIILLILMGIYSWASFSLGLKASNLTNRGIVSKGPYKYIRHPAYVCKNIAWWIGGTPLLIGNLITGQYDHFFIVIFSLFAWSIIYYYRAITEEKHLSLDPDYIKYKQKVKYKFIPKIF